MSSNTGNTLDFAGRTAIVTGGSQGIGFGVAERLLASGANVSIWAVNQDRLKHAAAKLDGGGHVQTVSTDIGNLASVEAATKAVLDAYGQIDVLINNAGVAGPNVKMWEFPPDAFAHMMHVNVDGTFYCCRTIVPHMIARNYGRIVNVSSIAGKEGNPNDGAYSTSKAAQIALTKSSRQGARQLQHLRQLRHTIADSNGVGDDTLRRAAQIHPRKGASRSHAEDRGGRKPDLLDSVRGKFFHHRSDL